MQIRFWFLKLILLQHAPDGFGQFTTRHSFGRSFSQFGSRAVAKKVVTPATLIVQSPDFQTPKFQASSRFFGQRPRLNNFSFRTTTTAPSTTSTPTASTTHATTSRQDDTATVGQTDQSSSTAFRSINSKKSRYPTSLELRKFPFSQSSKSRYITNTNATTKKSSEKKFGRHLNLSRLRAKYLKDKITKSEKSKTTVAESSTAPTTISHLVDELSSAVEGVGSESKRQKLHKHRLQSEDFVLDVPDSTRPEVIPSSSQMRPGELNTKPIVGQNNHDDVGTTENSDDINSLHIQATANNSIEQSVTDPESQTGVKLVRILNDNYINNTTTTPHVVELDAIGSHENVGQHLLLSKQSEDFGNSVRIEIEGSTSRSPIIGRKIQKLKKVRMSQPLVEEGSHSNTPIIMNSELTKEVPPTVEASGSQVPVNRTIISGGGSQKITTSGKYDPSVNNISRLDNALEREDHATATSIPKIIVTTSTPLQYNQIPVATLNAKKEMYSHGNVVNSVDLLKKTTLQADTNNRVSTKSFDGSAEQQHTGVSAYNHITTARPLRDRKKLSLFYPQSQRSKSIGSTHNQIDEHLNFENSSMDSIAELESTAGKALPINLAANQSFAQIFKNTTQSIKYGKVRVLDDLPSTSTENPTTTFTTTPKDIEKVNSEADDLVFEETTQTSGKNIVEDHSKRIDVAQSRKTILPTAAVVRLKKIMKLKNSSLVQNSTEPNTQSTKPPVQLSRETLKEKLRLAVLSVLEESEDKTLDEKIYLLQNKLLTQFPASIKKHIQSVQDKFRVSAKKLFLFGSHQPEKVDVSRLEVKERTNNTVNNNSERKSEAGVANFDIPAVVQTAQTTTGTDAGLKSGVGHGKHPTSHLLKKQQNLLARVVESSEIISDSMTLDSGAASKNDNSGPSHSNIKSTNKIRKFTLFKRISKTHSSRVGPDVTAGPLKSDKVDNFISADLPSPLQELKTGEGSKIDLMINEVYKASKPTSKIEEQSESVSNRQPVVGTQQNQLSLKPATQQIEESAQGQLSSRHQPQSLEHPLSSHSDGYGSIDQNSPLTYTYRESTTIQPARYQIMGSLKEDHVPHQIPIREETSSSLKNLHPEYDEKSISVTNSPKHLNKLIPIIQYSKQQQSQGNKFISQYPVDIIGPSPEPSYDEQRLHGEKSGNVNLVNKFGPPKYNIILNAQLETKSTNGQKRSKLHKNMYAEQHTSSDSGLDFSSGDNNQVSEGNFKIVLPTLDQEPQQLYEDFVQVPASLYNEKAHLIHQDKITDGSLLNKDKRLNVRPVKNRKIRIWKDVVLENESSSHLGSSVYNNNKLKRPSHISETSRNLGHFEQTGALSNIEFANFVYDDEDGMKILNSAGHPVVQANQRPIISTRPSLPQSLDSVKLTPLFITNKEIDLNSELGLRIQSEQSSRVDAHKRIVQEGISTLQPHTKILTHEQALQRHREEINRLIQLQQQVIRG